MNMLIVDDDPMIVNFFSNIANIEGHKDIDTAFSGEEALAKIVRKNYDLITLDIEMPGMSGLEALTLVRNMAPHTIIAMISGNIPESVMDDLAGCADLTLMKPVDIDVLIDLLHGAQTISDTMRNLRALEAKSSHVKNSSFSL